MRWQISDEKFELAFSSLLLLFIGLLIYRSFSYSQIGRLFPLIVGVPTAVILLFIVGRQLNVVLDEDSELADYRDTMKSRKRTVEVSIVILFMFVCIYVFGFIVGLAVSLLVVHWRFAALSVSRTIIHTALIMLFVYLVFEVLLKSRLYSGII